MGNHIERLDPRLLFAAGDLDPTYGTAGTVTHTLPASLPYPQVAIQGGDRVLLAGTENGAASGMLALTRFRADGSIDPRFFGSSVMAQDPRGMQSVSAIAVMPDDRIVVAGESIDDGGQILFLTPSGKIDRSRGRNGALELPTPDPVNGIGTAFTIDAIAAGADGSLYVAGVYDDFAGFDFAVAKFTPHGQLDQTFGTDGDFIIPEQSQDPEVESLEPRSINLRSDGNILVQADDQRDFTRPQFVLLSPSGQRLPFNFVNPSGGDTVFCDGATTLKDGSLLEVESDTSEIRLAKFDAEGNHDPHFATHGVLDLGENTFELPRFGKPLDVQPDGKVLLSLGGTLKRLDGKSGALDPTFGVNGVESNTGQLIGIGSGGSIIAATIPDDGSSATLERRFADEGPVGLLSARAISSVPTVPYKFVVQWRDDDGIDPSSLLSGLQIIGPDGNTYRAHLLGTIAQNANALFAIYKFTAPGGSWSAIDDGTYTVRVRSAKVKDSNAVATPAGNLGTFTVAI